MLRRALLALLPLAAFAQPPVRIVLVGDSTVAPQNGWGPGFAASFNPSVEVLNHAMNGRSSKSFRAENRWEPALAAKADYVLIQFGHNDCPGKGPDRETDAATTFRDNLRRYVREARAAGATPVLVTSIVRRLFAPNGEFQPDVLVQYAEATRAVARELQVPLMEMQGLTQAQALWFGAVRAKELGLYDQNGKLDTTHLGAFGQREVGRLAALELARVVPALRPRLR